MMSRRYRRKNNNILNVFFSIILIFLIGILCYKIYTEQINPKSIKTSNNESEKNSKKEDNTKKEKKEITSKEEKNKQTNINNESKKESTTTKASDKPSSNEKKENKNENRRRGDSIKIELIGDEQITIEKGSKYSDPGFKAVYSDGSDASSEVEIENSVNSSEEGSYTVTYFAGNNVVIRRVFVK